MSTPRFDEALAFCSRSSRRRSREGADVPLISHLLVVAGTVLENGGDEDAAIGALLHEAPVGREGGRTIDTIRSAFGDAVAEVVVECTAWWPGAKPSWQERKDAHVASMPFKREASILVALADETHHLRLILSEHAAVGDDLWDRLPGGREGTMGYYRALGTAFAALRRSRLSTEFKRLVDELRRSKVRQDLAPLHALIRSKSPFI